MDAAFCEAMHAALKVNAVALVAAYIGASRVRKLDKIYSLRPFSPVLFAQGPPKGPDILLRKLTEEITP